jgi:hypothetical protein
VEILNKFLDNTHDNANLFFCISNKLQEILKTKANIYFASCRHRLGVGIGGKRAMINVFYEEYCLASGSIIPNCYRNFPLVLDDNITSVTKYISEGMHRNFISPYICSNEDAEKHRKKSKLMRASLISIYDLYITLIDQINTQNLYDNLIYGIYKGKIWADNDFSLTPNSYTNSNKIYKLLILNLLKLKNINSIPSLYYCPFACTALEDVIYNNHFQKYLEITSIIFNHYFLRFAHVRGKYEPDFNECLPPNFISTMGNIPSSEPVYFMLAQYIITMININCAQLLIIKNDFVIEIGKKKKESI